MAAANEANEQFRAARERTASLVSPDVCLSRQELAELVNAWVWEHCDKKVVAASANYIGQIERGKIRWPGRLYREAFRAILGGTADASLGFVNGRSARAAAKLENVDRKKFLRTSRNLGVLAALGPVAALLEDIKPTPVPRRVGAGEIEQIRTITRVVQILGLYLRRRWVSRGDRQEPAALVGRPAGGHLCGPVASRAVLRGW